MSTRSDDIIDVTVSDSDAPPRRSAMFIRSCIVLLMWGLLVASCSMR